MGPPTKKRSNSFIENSDEELENKPKNKVQKENTQDNIPEEGLNIQENADGEKYFEIGRSRRVTMRTFKNTPLIDVREFWTKEDGTPAPGKKGISLKPEEASI